VVGRERERPHPAVSALSGYLLTNQAVCDRKHVSVNGSIAHVAEAGLRGCWRNIPVTLTDLGIGRFSMSEIERLRPSVIELPIAAFARHDSVGKLFMLAEGSRNFAQY
jgi:hypothetical protein